MGGEGGVVESVPPQIISVEVEGLSFKSGQSVAGITSEATITFRFNVPMDPVATWQAYEAKGSPIAENEVTYRWFEGETVLVIYPNQPLPYPDVDSEDEPTEAIEFSIGEGAVSLAQIPLEDHFFGSLFMLRRVHRTISPNRSRSTDRLGYAGEVPVAGFRSSSTCPWHEDVPAVLDDNDFLERAAGLESLIATGEEGSVGIYAYDIDFADELVKLESAELELGKWADPSWSLSTAQYPDYEFRMNQLDFSVDALKSGALSPAQALATPLRSNIKDQSGQEFQRGFGLFSLDVTDWLEERLEAEDPSLSFRLEFDGQRQNPNTWQSCAGLLFHVSYLIE